MTPSEQITRQFLEWEPRGRGSQVWQECVRPEPAFAPFTGYDLGRADSDDGRRDTLGSRLMNLAGLPIRWGRKTRETDDGEEEPVPTDDSEPRPLVAIETRLRSDRPVSPALFEQFLTGVSNLVHPVSFEILGTGEWIVVQWVVSGEDVDQFLPQLQIFFPDLGFNAYEMEVGDLWPDDERELSTLIVDFGLEREFMRPLRTFSGMNTDPLLSVLAAMSTLLEGESAMVQVLFEPVVHPWAESMLRSVTDWKGGAVFLNDNGLASQTRRKVSRPLYAATLRLCVRSDTDDAVMETAKGIVGGLAMFADSDGNELIPLDSGGYAFDDRWLDVRTRRTRRSGMILNLDELVGLVHFPSPSVRIPKLHREEKRTKAAPQSALSPSLVLGVNEHEGRAHEVGVSVEQRLRHTHIIGGSGSGKSNLMHNLILQDIADGQGVAVLDPHGDLIDRVIGNIPDERIDDVVLFDPADEEHPVGFNILDAKTRREKIQLESDLVAVFRQHASSWGDQMTTVLENAVHAILESDRGGTLFDLRRLLIDPTFRRDYLASVHDDGVVQFWQHEYPMLKGNSQGSILIRLNQFLRRDPIRCLVAQKENRLDFRSFFDSGKIFLAKLSLGSIGEENAYLLGALLLARIHQCAIGRQDVAESDRRPFWLYIDEFQHFVMPSLKSVLSGARKYGLGMTLAHHDMRQLESADKSLASAVMTHPATRVCFRMGLEDARAFRDSFSFFEVADVQNLQRGEAVARIERADADFNLRVPWIEDANAPNRRSRMDAVRHVARERYATPKAEVDALIRSMMATDTTTSSGREVVEESPKGERKAPMPGKETKATPAAPTLPKPANEDLTVHEGLKESLTTAAEELLYTVTREHPVLDGKGRVDLLFVRGKRSVACEIAITTTVEWEMGNIRKCLDAGFAHVMVVAPERPRLDKLETAATATFKKTELKRVRFVLPEELVAQLTRWARLDPDGGEVEKSKPRKHKLSLGTPDMTESERRQREKEMLEELAKVMRTKKTDQ